MIRYITLTIACLFFAVPPMAQSGQTVFTFEGGGVHQSETDLSDSEGE